MFLLDTIKKNKFASILVVVLLLFIIKDVSPRSFMENTSGDYSQGKVMVAPAGMPTSDGVAMYRNEMALDVAEPIPEAGGQRMVIQNSFLSLLVKNVSDARSEVIKYAESLGGYFVDSNIQNPQDNASATITLRIPSEKLNASLDYFRSKAIKVVSETLQGSDVTDQYSDLATQITQYEKTKAKFEEILSRAQEVSDITNLTQQINQTQRQIDSLKGRQMALEQNAKLSKITIYLATDEYSLPYVPEQSFRPDVIFKRAVRSLVAFGQRGAELVIWAAVYSIIWVPVLIIIFLIVSRMKKN